MSASSPNTGRQIRSCREGRYFAQLVPGDPDRARLAGAAAQCSLHLDNGSHDFTVSSASTIKGLQLRATDAVFETGAGAEVAGPFLSALVMAMAGRLTVLEQLTGPGVQVLADRITPRQ